EPKLSSCLQSIPGVYTRAEILHERIDDEDDEDLPTPQNEAEDRLSMSLEKHSPETPIHSHLTRRMNLVELLTKQGITARTIDSYSEFEKAFLTCPLPNRLPNSTNKVIPDPDDTEEDDDEPTTPPSSPTQGAQIQTSALLHQVVERLVKLSLTTLKTITTSLTSSIDQDQIENNEDELRLRTVLTTTPPSSPTFDDLVAPTPNTALHAIKTSTFLRASALNPFTKTSMQNVLTTLSPSEKPSLVDDFIRRRF
ncbi:unnamed protein product, partial [Rotaria magnacalcarata]